MKKNLLFMTLFISVLFLSQPSFLFASKNSEARVMENENFSEDEDPIVSAAKHFGGLPKDNGYKLVKTNTIGGLKCEHYVFENKEYRVFYNKSGDFITIPEDKDGFDVEPDEIKICGVYKLHFEEGIIEGGFDLTNRNVVMKTTYKNGIIKYDVMRYLINPRISWSIFKEANYTGSNYRNYFQSDGSIYYTPIGSGYVLLNKPNEVFVKQTWNSGKWWSLSGLLIGKRIYSVYDDGSLGAVGQLFENKAIPCLASDSIVGYNGKDCYNYKIKYANGDSIEARNGSVYGILHRGGAIAKFNYDDPDGRCRIQKADGSVFRGNLCWFDGYGCDHPIEAHQVPTLVRFSPHYGTLRFPDGRSYRYEAGKSEIEIKAKEEAKKKEQEAYNKAVYDAVCKKFGKRYVDAAAQGNIIIGMPEELFKGTFKCSLTRTEANRKCYYVYGMAAVDSGNRITLTNKVTKIVWVTNGKVSSVTNKTQGRVKVL